VLCHEHNGTTSTNPRISNKIKRKEGRRKEEEEGTKAQREDERERQEG